VTDHRRDKLSGTIIFLSVGFALALTAAIGILIPPASPLVPSHAAHLAAVLNAALAIAGSAAGGLAAGGDRIERAMSGTMSALVGLALYGVGIGVLSCFGLV